MAVMVLAQGHKFDFILWTSVDYGVTRVGDPVVFYDDYPDLSEVDELCLVGHGEPGKIETHSAKSIAQRLTTGPKKVPDTFKRLIITSCYAGCLVNGKAGTAVIDVVAKALTDRGLKGIPVSGALGPSIKANQLGNVFKVVNSKSATKSPGDIQSALLSKHRLSAPVKGETVRYCGNVGDPKLASEAAAIMAKISGEFYKEFVGKLEDVNALYDPEHSMRTVTS